MSSISQTTDNGNSVSDFATKFMKKFRLGRLLFKCNTGKEKGIPVSHCLLSAAEDKNLICNGKACDGRFLAGKRRLQGRSHYLLSILADIEKDGRIIPA